MALIELATNHDVNAIVEAIRSLKPENDTTMEIAKSFVVPFASAFFGVVGAYKFQNKLSKRQLQAKKVVELNAIAQEIDRLARQLLARKAWYHKTLTDEPYQRLCSTRSVFRDFRPPRFQPDGRITLGEEIGPSEVLTILDIDDLFSDFELCFERWTALQNWHLEFTSDKDISVWGDADIYIEALKKLKPPMEKMFLADYVMVLTDYLLLRSYYYIVGIRKSCVRQFDRAAIEAAGGLFFSKISSPTDRAELLKPVVAARDPQYPKYVRDFIGDREVLGLESPTPEQIEIDQKIGAST